MALNRDRDAYDSILATLNGLGIFDAVVFAKDPSRDNTNSSQGRVAVLIHRTFTQKDDGTPFRQFRLVHYTLAVKFREEDPVQAYADLDLVAAKTHNAIDNLIPGGFTTRQTSGINSGLYDESKHPDYVIRFEGTFGYVVEFGSGYSTTP